MTSVPPTRILVSPLLTSKGRSISLPCESFCMRTFNSFTDVGKEDFKTESAKQPTEMNSQDSISEDSDSRMHNMHVAIKRASMPANMIHNVWREMDYHMDAARVTEKAIMDNYYAWK
ncbi:hypothetical protein AVEN_28301-1 [Araneus ventricosus]|uniref:Uncharacterized protein n=1 Tax=Araneus ventricosus TaxID=182803 RepID=A0A4Y2M1R0_ARAVE|nr:hypothetical protein AVEN_28301-1 [Araneus ventricosus]